MSSSKTDIKYSVYCGLALELRDKEEKVKGGRTGLPDRRDMSSKEESSDDGYFAQDSSEVPALGERDRFVCEGWQRVKIEGRAALPC